MVIGAGAIVIGQGAEFDYSGTQACKDLKSEGYAVVHVNSDPATIMTDPETAERVYIEPLTAEILEKVIGEERPDAVLPTIGGQTGLNLSTTLASHGVLERYTVELIGAKMDAIQKGEDRLLFLDAMERIGIECCPSAIAENMIEVEKVARKLDPILSSYVQFLLLEVQAVVLRSIEKNIFEWLKLVWMHRLCLKSLLSSHCLDGKSMG